MTLCPHCKRQHAPRSLACQAPAEASAGGAATMPAEEDQLPRKHDLRGVMVGSWKIIGLLGKGGMGKVYAAKDPVSGAQVAIKVLDIDDGALEKFPAEERRRREGEFKERFLREAQVASKVGRNQPNIIQILTFGRLEDDRPYFVMEFLHGRSLDDRIAKAPPRGAELRRLLEQVCDAMAVIHKAGVQHRDLKPENIWISEPGVGPTSAKVLDFGLSKLEGANNLTRPGEAMGSVHYMSPEQAQAKVIDVRSDIYAFGAVLREIITGKRLFDEPGRSDISVLLAAVTMPPPPLMPRPGFTVSPELVKLIADCLEKKPELRPQTMAEVKTRLMSALDACANCEGPAVSEVSLEDPSLQKTAPSLPELPPLTLQKTVEASQATPAQASREVSHVPSSIVPPTEVLLASAWKRSRIAWLLGICLLALCGAAVVVAVRRSNSRAAAAMSPPSPVPSPVSASPVVLDPRPAPPTAAPLATRSPGKADAPTTRRSPRETGGPRARATAPLTEPPRTMAATLQPGPPHSAPAHVLAPPAEKTSLPLSESPAPALRAAVPAIESPKPLRQLTPSERDLITDKDLLLR
jgi:serine/threonine protein kinase